MIIVLSSNSWTNGGWPVSCRSRNWVFISNTNTPPRVEMTLGRLKGLHPAVEGQQMINRVVRANHNIECATHIKAGHILLVKLGVG